MHYGLPPVMMPM